MLQILTYHPRYHQGVLDVVRDVNQEHGYAWEPDGYHRDLSDIEASYLSNNGRFWVLAADDRVQGCAAVTLNGSHAELHRLYILSQVRGGGWGRKLLQVAIDHAQAHSCKRMSAWSDPTRLPQACALYRAMGFVQSDEMRLCDDAEQCPEYAFWKDLT